jgi:hypothetical protein
MWKQIHNSFENFKYLRAPTCSMSSLPLISSSFYADQQGYYNNISNDAITFVCFRVHLSKLMCRTPVNWFFRMHIYIIKFCLFFACIRVKYLHALVFVYTHLNHLPPFVVRINECETHAYVFVFVYTGVHHFHPFVLVI